MKHKKEEGTKVRKEFSEVIPPQTEIGLQISDPNCWSVHFPKELPGVQSEIRKKKKNKEMDDE
jgi:hypothetical protein